MSITEIERDVIGWNSQVLAIDTKGQVYSFALALEKVSYHEGGESAVTLTDIHPFALGFLLSFGYVIIDNYRVSIGGDSNEKSTLCLTRKGGNIVSAFNSPKGLKVTVNKA